MQIFITLLHIVVCIVLILVILLQAGKGASMGAAFGGSSQTVFGSSGPASFLGKLTTAVAVLFMITSLTLSYSAAHKGKSVMDGAARTAAERKLPPAQPQPQAAPIQPSVPSGAAGQPVNKTPQPAR